MTISRRRPPIRGLLLILLLAGAPTLGASAAETALPDEASRIKSIYGDDDRQDEYQISDAALLRAGDATVALIEPFALTDNGDGTYTIDAERFGAAYDLCPGEAFTDQPVAAFCTGFLVSADVIATAGHCVLDRFECADTAVVFGFVMQDEDTPALRVNASDVYYCAELIASRTGSVDWGLLRLDRAVTGHDPLTVRTSGLVPDDEPLLNVGHPNGLPRKYDIGATVRDNTPTNQFISYLDAFGGSSGSPVFSASTLVVEGIVVAGDEDFFYQRRPANCFASRVFPEEGGYGTEVTRITALADEILSLSADGDADGDPDEGVDTDGLDDDLDNGSDDIDPATGTNGVDETGENEADAPVSTCGAGSGIALLLCSLAQGFPQRTRRRSPRP